MAKARWRACWAASWWARPDFSNVASSPPFAGVAVVARRPGDVLELLFKILQQHADVPLEMYRWRGVLGRMQRPARSGEQSLVRLRDCPSVGQQCRWRDVSQRFLKSPEQHHCRF